MIKEGHVLVGDRARQMITIHTCPDGTLVKKVKCDYSIALGVNSKKQILCQTSPLHCEIKAIDYHGNEVFTFTPKIDEDLAGGKVAHVYGSVCDAKDNIYLTMLVLAEQSEDKLHYSPNTGHLHMYNPEGQYQSCIASGIEHPFGLTITPDGLHLVVANHHSILKYKVQ